MADLASTDLTYTVSKIEKLEDGRKIVHATIAFGDGALTYPTGGVPILKGSFGCPTYIYSLDIFDKGGSGYDFAYDQTNQKLRMFQSAAQATHTHDLLLKDAAVADGATTRVNAGANLIGANTGSDITIAGGGANGGVVLGGAVAAAAGSELTNSVAPAAQSIKVMVIGY